MPVPKPRNGESRNEFMSRCVTFLRDEGTPQEQAVAICSQKWEDKMPNEMLLKDINIEVKEVDDKERTITAIGSKEVVDRDGDIVKVNGVNFKNYKKNPVVLLNHNYHDFPIGKAVGKKVWRQDGKLMFKIQFAPEDTNPKAGIAYKLYKGGYMSAFSIGFIPDFETIEYPDKGKKGARRIFNNSELLEISAVSVPANQEALMASFTKAWDDGVLDGEELNEVESWLEKSEEEVEFEHKIVDKLTVDKLIEDKDTEIAELKLMLKEQEMDDEIEWDDYIAELFNDDSQASGSETDANASQTEEEFAEWALTTLEETDKDE